MKLQATGNDLLIIESERMISGSVNIYKCEFVLDSSWDGYMVTAVFSTGNRTVNMPIVDGVCDIPVEVMRPRAKFHVGIVGVDGDITRPSAYSDWVQVEQGANVNAAAGNAPEQSVLEAWMATLDAKHEEWNAQEQARQDAEAARVEAEQAREDLETGYVAQAKAYADSAEAAAKYADDAREVIEDVVEGNFATKTYVDQQIAAIPTPDVSGQIGAHNTDETAHADIREELENHTHTAEDVAGVAAEGHKHTAADVGARPDTWMPTAADVGAVSKSGDTMTGNLYIERTWPSLFVKDTTTGRLGIIQGNSSSGALNIYAQKDNSNRTNLTLAPETQSNSGLLTLTKTVAGSTASYNVYHTGNKPTAADIGAAGIATGTYTGTGGRSFTLTFSVAPKVVLIAGTHGHRVFLYGSDGDDLGDSTSYTTMSVTWNSTTSATFGASSTSAETKYASRWENTSGTVYTYYMIY